MSGQNFLYNPSLEDRGEFFFQAVLLKEEFLVV